MPARASRAPSEGATAPEVAGTFGEAPPLQAKRQASEERCESQRSVQSSSLCDLRSWRQLDYEDYVRVACLSGQGARKSGRALVALARRREAIGIRAFFTYGKAAFQHRAVRLFSVLYFVAAGIVAAGSAAHSVAPLPLVNTAFCSRSTAAVPEKSSTSFTSFKRIEVSTTCSWVIPTRTRSASGEESNGKK